MQGGHRAAAFVTVNNSTIAFSPAAKSATVLTEPCLERASRRLGEMGFTKVYWSPAEDADSLDFQAGVCIDGGLVFLSAAELEDAMSKDVPLLLTLDGAAVGFIGSREQTLAYLRGEIPDCGQYSLKNSSPLVRDAASLYEANEKARGEELRRRLEQGVVIPLSDGVIISPAAEIAAGASVLQGSTVAGKSSIASGAVIGPHSYIESSSVGENSVVKHSVVLSSSIGNGCTVGPFSQLRPDSRLGDGVKVGDFVEIKNSSVGDGTSVSHLTYIGDADVGRFVNFGCGTVVVNYDGEKKARTAVGDYAFIGCNTNLVAPVSVGEAAFTAAGTTVTKDVEDGDLVVGRAENKTVKGWGKRKLAAYIEKKNKQR